MKRTCAALTVLAGLVPLAIGQVTRPTVYVWSSGGHPFEVDPGVSPQDPNADRHYVVTPDLKVIVRPYLVDNTSPATAARWAANEILKRLASTGPDHLSNGEISLSLSTFGRDIWWTGDANTEYTGVPGTYKGGLDCDSAVVRERALVRDYNPETGKYNLPAANGQFYNSPLRFFTEADRLPAVGGGATDDLAFFGQAFFNANTSRTYRNPVFLHNANPDPNNPPPLKKWMMDFCDAYAKIQGGPDFDDPLDPFWGNSGHTWNGPGTLPNPGQFHLDTEVNISWVNDKNLLVMLYRMAETENTFPPNSTGYQQFNFWSNHAYEVPGTGGKTMSELYYEERTTQAFEWPVDVTDTANGGIILSQRPIDDRNRPFMIWYSGVCRTAYEAVMKNCFYDVVKSHWLDCKTSNYDNGTADGAIGSTGWYMDADGTKVGDNYPDRVASNQVIRSWAELYHQTGGNPWHEVSGLWSNYPRSTAANKSAPVSYKLDAHSQWQEGELEYGSLVQETPTQVRPAYCDQQPNLYYGPPTIGNDNRPRVLETLEETSIRMIRQEIEACINSNGGGHQSDVVPWMALAHAGGSTPKYFRDVLGMFRSHKIQGVIGFTGANVAAENRPDHQDRQTAILQWNDTQRMFDQVYSPYVADYSIAHGQIPDLVDWEVVPSRLEFAKLATDQPPASVTTVDVQSVVNNDGDAQASVEVVFKGLVGHNTGYFSKMHPDNTDAEHAYGYTLNLECSLWHLPGSDSSNGDYGTIEVFDWATSEWVYPRMLDSTQDELFRNARPRFSRGVYYTFNTDDKSMRLAVDIRSRLGGNGLPIQEFVLHDDATLDGVAWQRGTMRLRLNHFSNSTSAQFVSTYDLVQVIPFPYVVAQPSGSGAVVSVDPDEPVPATGEFAKAAGGTVYPHGFTPYTYEPVDVAAWPHAPEYYANPTVSKYNPNSIWEPSSLDKVTCTPVHSNDWNYAADHPSGPASWAPAGFDANDEVIPNSRLITSWFNLPVGSPNRQSATARFTLPVWTDAPETADLALQPYTVWYWITRENRWQEVTQGMDVKISRNSADLNREVVVSSKASAPFQAGYYSLDLNLASAASSPPSIAAGERYSVYCSGNLQEPGTKVRANTSILVWSDDDEDWVTVPLLQYNFRLYPDCDFDDVIDSTEAQCNYYGGTDCRADVDDGTGTGYPDGGVDINDLLFFLHCFETGQLCADLSGFPDAGVPDAGVDINDLLFFLVHFELGC